MRGPRLRNITEVYAALPHDSGGLPLRVDAASPLTSYLLGPEWYPSDGDHRWMPRRATVRMGAPTASGQKLYLRGSCPDEQLKDGPLPVTVEVEGVKLPPAVIRPGENAFELAFAAARFGGGQTGDACNGGSGANLPSGQRPEGSRARLRRV